MSKCIKSLNALQEESQVTQLFTHFPILRIKLGDESAGSLFVNHKLVPILVSHFCSVLQGFYLCLLCVIIRLKTICEMFNKPMIKLAPFLFFCENVVWVHHTNKSTEPQFLVHTTQSKPLQIDETFCDAGLSHPTVTIDATSTTKKPIQLLYGEACSGPLHVE